MVIVPLRGPMAVASNEDHRWNTCIWVDHCMGGGGRFFLSARMATSAYQGWTNASGDTMWFLGAFREHHLLDATGARENVKKTGERPRGRVW